MSIMMATSTTGPDLDNLVCDYLVIGGGATGMAFVDTLLHSCTEGVSVVVVDNHPEPGGQWHDSYEFIRLHQPSAMYGVESERLEPTINISEEERKSHRATRIEILTYYKRVKEKLQSKFDFRFIGSAWFDFAVLTNYNQDSAEHKNATYSIRQTVAAGHDVNMNFHVRKRLVDARFLQPDLPINTPAKFFYDTGKVNVVPVNSICTANTNISKHYVVIGGGKTGMDAIVHLQSEMTVEPANIMWVVPNEVWITARENIISCMEYLNLCIEDAKRKGKATDPNFVMSHDFLQNGFLLAEQEGHVYRFKKNVLPTKFKDATLSCDEMSLISQVKNVVRKGRVDSILDDGTLMFVDGSMVKLPWDSNRTTFLHCSAGAFNYTKQAQNAPPIFQQHMIKVQDVYGTPGFCFVGSIIARLEAQCNRLSDEVKNSMLLTPESGSAPHIRTPNGKDLGPSGGDIGHLTPDHGLIQRLSNLRKWYDVPGISRWLAGHRLYNLGHKDEEKVKAMLEETWQTLAHAQLVST